MLSISVLVVSSLLAVEASRACQLKDALFKTKEEIKIGVRDLLPNLNKEQSDRAQSLCATIEYKTMKDVNTTFEMELLEPLTPQMVS